MVDYKPMQVNDLKMKMTYNQGKNNCEGLAVRVHGVVKGIVVDASSCCFFISFVKDLYVEMNEYNNRLLSMLRASQDTESIVYVYGHVAKIADEKGLMKKLVAHKIDFNDYTIESKKTIDDYVKQQGLTTSLTTNQQTDDGEEILNP